MSVVALPQHRSRRMGEIRPPAEVPDAPRPVDRAGRAGAAEPGAAHCRGRAGQMPADSRGPLPVPISQAGRDLLADAARGLGRAIRAESAAERYSAAHLAALRAAAAVLAARARPGRGRRASVWDLLVAVAPEFGEWAAFFAAGSAKRQAADAGVTRLVSGREADDMVRQSAAFLDLVESALGAVI